MRKEEQDMADDYMFDVQVNIRVLWKKPSESMAEEVARKQAQIRFDVLAHEVARMVEARLEVIRREQGDNPHVWVLLPPPNL